MYGSENLLCPSRFENMILIISGENGQPEGQRAVSDA